MDQVPRIAVQARYGVIVLTPPTTEVGIHQHSTEERLRRLEKIWVSNPEMARQFERERSGASQSH